MQLHRDQKPNRLVVSIPAPEVDSIRDRLRTIVDDVADPLAATRARRMLMQLRGEDGDATITAPAADVLLVLDWGLRAAAGELEDVLAAERPLIGAADAAYARVREYMEVLAEMERLELEDHGLSLEDLLEPGPEPVLALDDVDLPRTERRFVRRHRDAPAPPVEPAPLRVVS